MAETVEDILRDMRSILSRGGGGGFGGGGFSGGGSSGGGGGNGGFLQTALLNSVTGLQQLYQGSFTASTGLKMFTDTMDKFPIKIPILSNLVNNSAELLGQTMINTNNVNNEFGKSGVTFNNNVTDFAEKLANAGISQEQYRSILDKNANFLSGLGSTMNKSQANFLAFEKGFRETDFVNQLRTAGVSAADAAAIGESMMVNQRGLNLADESSRRKAIESAIELAGAFEENTRITGISKKQQEEELMQAKADARVGVTNMELGPGGGLAWDKMTADFMTQSEGVKNLIKEIWVNNGIRTEKGGTTGAALGDAEVAVEKAVRLRKAAANDESLKAAADAAAAEANIAIIKRTQSKDFAESVKQGDSSYQEAAADIFSGSKALASTMAAQAENVAKGGDASVAAAAAAQRKSVRQDIYGIDEKTGKPTQDVGAILGKTLNNIDRTITDSGALLATGVNKAVSSLHTFGDALQSFNDTMLKPRTPETVAETIKSVTDKMIPGGITTTSTKTPEELAKPVHRSRADGSPGMRDFLKGGGSFDNIFEHFDENGELAILHGDEVVANRAQMNQFRSQVVEHIGGIMKTNTATTAEPTSAATEIESAFQDMPKPELADQKPDYAKIASDLQARFASVDTTEITEKFSAISKEIQPPDLNKVFTDVGAELKNSTATFKIPDIKPMLGDFETNFSKISADLEKVPADFTDVSANINAPNFNDIFTTFKTQFSDISKKFTPPDLNQVVKDAGSELDKVAVEYKTPDFANLLAPAKENIEKTTKEMETPSFTKIFYEIGNQFGKLNPMIDKTLNEAGETFNGVISTFTPPNIENMFNEVGNQFGKLNPMLDDMVSGLSDGFDSITSGFELPDFDDVMTDVSGGFDSITSGFELPDFDDVITDVSDGFTSITDGFELPDFGNMFSELESNFSSLTDDFEPPETDGMLKNMTDSMTDLTTKLEPPPADDLMKKQLDKFMMGSSFKSNALYTPESEKMLPEQNVQPKANATSEISPWKMDFENYAQIQTPQQQLPINIGNAIKEQAPPPPPPPAPAPPPPPPPQVKETAAPEQNVPWKDFVVQLETMNGYLAKIATHASETVDLSSKQIRATQGLSSNRI